MLVQARHPDLLLQAPQRPDTSTRSETVDAVIPVKSPNPEWLDLTLGGLERQTHQPRVTVVDCMTPPVEIDTALESQVVQAGACSRGGQRRAGVAATDGDVVLHLDEDAVLARQDHIERMLEHLEEPGVSGVGGSVTPIRGNRLGALAANLSPVTAWFPMHRRSVCPDGRECFPEARRGRFHGDDAMLKQVLQREGRLVHDGDLVVLTDLPTRKQRTAAGLVGAAATLLLG